jgi:adenine-specific DNA methylase
VTDSLAERKQRGAFFTPPVLSRFIADWAVRTSDDVILEPSCGEASFLLAAGDRLRRIGANKLLWGDQLHGIEIHRASAKTAASVLGEERFDATIRVADFFDVKSTPAYDAVIGNPPYIRYQDFSGDARVKGLEAALANGVRLSRLASSWAAFVVHAAQFLKPAGRLGLVLPAELLTVNYAAQVRRFLLHRFGKVRLVMFENRVFPGVLTEVVLLLAEGTGGAPSFEVYQARGLDDLPAMDTGAWTDFRPDGGDKWTPALISPSLFGVYQELSTSGGFSPLLEWGETYLGAVTGNNDYFALTRPEIRSLGLRDSDLLKISPPGSRHLRGLTFTDRAWERLGEEDASGFLFYPAKDEPRAAASAYIESGKRRNVHKTYKCANREPWWRVPVVAVPDLFLTYMNQDRPRLITNDAGVHIINSLYGVALKSDRKRLGRDLLPIACLNSLTLLGAEMVGRSYGGGLLKLEPKEADVLPVPSLSALEAAGDKLRNVRHVLSTALRQGDLLRAADVVDRVILVEHLKVPESDINALRQARDLLFQRRRSRGKNRGES